MSRRNKKLLDVPGSFLDDSGLQVTYIPQFEFRRILIYSSKTTQSFITASSPIFSLSKMMLGLGPKLLAGGGAMCRSITDLCKCFTLKGSHLQQLWQSHTMASILWALPLRPTDQLKREHNVQPLNHPSDGLVWSQESVIILENKRSWIDMLTSFSWWEAGKVGFHSCQPREGSAHLFTLLHFMGLMWIILHMDKDVAWSSADRNFIQLYLTVRNKHEELGNVFSNFGL